MKMAGLVLIASLTTATAAAPKVGCSVSLMKSLYLYQSNAFFRERPIAEQMIKDGIDLCWYEGWEKVKSKSEKEKVQRTPLNP